MSIEAMRLADELDCRGMNRPSWKDQFDAGYELRRLHKENIELRQAIEQANVVTNDTSPERVDETAKQRHEQSQKQEPVAWANRVIGGRKWLSIHASKGASDKWLEYRIKEQSQGEEYEQIQLYTSPPQRQWVGLTEQERNELEDYCEMIIGKAAFDAIEKKLKEKNT